MPSASPYYNTSYPAMDKSDVPSDASSFFDIWANPSTISTSSFQCVPQQDIQSACNPVTHTLLGVATSTSNDMVLDSHPRTSENQSCPETLQASIDTTDQYPAIDYSNLVSWTNKHPENWTQAEVLDWLFFTAEKHGIDCSKLHGESFQDLAGAKLCTMTRDDFLKFEPEYGGLYYQVLQDMMKTGEFSEPLNSPLSDIPPFTEQDIRKCLQLTETATGRGDGSSSSLLSKTNYPSDYQTTEMSTYPFPCPSVPADVSRNPYSCVKQPLSAHQQATSSEEMSPFSNYSLADPTSPYMNPYYTTQYTPPRHHVSPYMGGPGMLMHPLPPPNQPRRPGRPRKANSVGCVTDVQSRRDRRGTGKNQHLWEFIYDTLMNPLYSPQYLRWENKQEGVFRFVQSEAVAQLWGNLKNNDNMTYEKLSRAMRHYYKRGILERVEGRRLVYKFSRTAMDRMRQRLNSV